MEELPKPLDFPENLPSEQRVNILLVDDQPANLLALEAILQELGHNLVKARSGEEALQRLLGDEFAVLLLDVQMPGLDGFETARLIRGREKSRHTPIIFLTAFESDRFPVERAYSLGAVDYLVKPLVPVIVQAKVAGFVELFEKTQQIKQQAERLRQVERREFEQRLAEENARLREQQELLRVTLASIGDAVITTDTAGRITNLNRLAETLTGWPNAEAVGQLLENVFRIVNQDTRQPVENPVARVLREGVLVGLANHTVLIARDGTERAIDDSAAPIRYREGEVIGCVLTFRDVTERRRAEAMLRRQANLLEQTHDAIFVWEFPGPILYWNQAAEQLYGFPQEEALGKISHDLLATIFPQQDRVAFETALERQGEFKGELIHTKKNGERITVESRIRLLTEADGRRLVLETSRDITERKAAAEEQRRLLAALSEADRRKDEFLATLAHELRNPLAPLRNSLQILKTPRVDAATARQTSEMMERQVDHLVRLVDDLLDVSRVMRGKIELRNERVELATVVARAVETAQPLIEAQGHELTVSLPPESLSLDADPVRLAQVIGNLLTNSAKYTEANGKISLTAEREGTDAVLRVQDTGIGIAPDMLPHIFELFVQADHAAARSQGGLGIGLTLVKNLVEMHHGNVEAHSAGLGRGSEFVIRLPLMPQEERQRVEDDSGEAPHEPARSSGHRLLVVDDNRDAADSLAMLLRLQGHEVRVAHDGPAALQLAAACRPELVFLDIGMPGMDGYEVARRLRQTPGLEKVVLAALTGWGQQEDRRRTAEAGFDHHLVKPVESKALESLLADMNRPEAQS